MSITVGVDLSAEPKGTAAAVLSWGSSARVESIQLGASNEVVKSLSSGAAKVGIDCAFGWPDEFVEFVSRHARGDPLDAPDESAITTLTS